MLETAQERYLDKIDQALQECRQVDYPKTKALQDDIVTLFNKQENVEYRNGEAKRVGAETLAFMEERSAIGDDGTKRAFSQDRAATNLMKAVGSYKNAYSVAIGKLQDLKKSVSLDAKNPQSQFYAQANRCTKRLDHLESVLEKVNTNTLVGANLNAP